MKTSEKMLQLLNQCRVNRLAPESGLNDKALDTIHSERNKIKATCYWLGFLRGVISSDGVSDHELEPLVIHTDTFLKQFSDEDAKELLEEMCNAWPDVSIEAEGLIDNILEYREEEALNGSGYNPINYFNGYLKGIACDNKISKDELELTLDLVERMPALSNDNRVQQLTNVILRALDDGEIDPYESDEICDWISRIVGDSFADTGISTPEDQATGLDFETSINLPELKRSVVAVTGLFDGPLSRKQIISRLQSMGTTISNNVSKKVDFLIIANEASKHWATTNAGTKLLKAHALKSKTGKPQLISERQIVELLNNVL